MKKKKNEKISRYTEINLEHLAILLRIFVSRVDIFVSSVGLVHTGGQYSII